jgi:Protein of unknown function (DUF2561)
MTQNTGAAARSRLNPMANDADNTDRILLAVCAAVWLAVLGSAVAAAVALVDLGSKHQESSTESGTPWLLYGVIGVSALVIVGAIPLLIRARRTALEDPRGAPGSAARPAPARTPDPRTQSVRTAQAPAAGARQRSAVSSSPGISTYDAGVPPAVDQVWLRCAVVIAIAMGVALLAIGIATYLMAAGHDTYAWAAYVVAGLVTLAMPAAPWIFLRQLRELTDKR